MSSHRPDRWGGDQRTDVELGKRKAYAPSTLLDARYEKGQGLCMAQSGGDWSGLLAQDLLDGADQFGALDGFHQTDILWAQPVSVDGGFAGIA